MYLKFDFENLKVQKRSILSVLPNVSNDIAYSMRDLPQKILIKKFNVYSWQTLNIKVKVTCPKFSVEHNTTTVLY